MMSQHPSPRPRGGREDRCGGGRGGAGAPEPVVGIEFSFD